MQRINTNKLLLAFLLFNCLFCYSQVKTIDSLKSAFKSANHDTTRCNILYSMIAAESDYTVWSKHNEQLRIITEYNLKSTLSSSKLNKFFKKYLAITLGNNGYISEVTGELSKALGYYFKALQAHREIGDKYGVSLTLNSIGMIYHNKGNFEKALEFYEYSLKTFKEDGDKKNTAQLLSNIANVYNSQGNIKKALEYFQAALKLQEGLHNKKGFALTLNNIATIYYSQRDLSLALEYFKKSLQISESMQDKGGVAFASNNIGSIMFANGNIIGALDQFKKSLKINEEIGDKRGIAYSLSNIGSAYSQGDPLITNSKEEAKKIGAKKSISSYTRSLMIQEEIGDMLGVVRSLNKIGLFYIEQENYPKAIEVLIKAMKISMEIGIPEDVKNAADLLSQTYKITGNHELALENYELYIQMRDSLNNVETQKATIKQQTQYEYDKKKAVEDEKHAAELIVQDEKAQADKKRQNIIIASVSVVLVLVAFFSILLFNRFKTAKKQKRLIEIKEKETQYQKHIIEEKQKEILDSINYAKRIQYTLLAHDNFLNENLPDHFVYFNPKDIVSGDFYWATKHNNKFYIAVCDSTGHGVPGAFMSLLNIGFLTEAINEKGIENPNEVFDYVRQKLTNTISKEGQKDGFDGILVCFNQKNDTVTYAAANNAPVLIRNSSFKELNADRMPVGVGERNINFTLHTLEMRKGDVLYLYTDGYADQFGGPKGKKFKYNQLNELLFSQHAKPLTEQHTELKNTFENWRGNLEQVDDVCVLGIKI